MEDKEKSDEQSSELENKLDQSKEKPNWFICFFKALARVYFRGFIGKDLITGEKASNRFLDFVGNIFLLTIAALPIALFISYFLITLPTWIFVLTIVQMALNLFRLVRMTTQFPQFPKQKKTEEQAKNHAKFYIYGQKYYKNRPTTLIGDFFRYIGTTYFAFLFGKHFIWGKKIKRSKIVEFNITNIISTLCFWALVIPCFFITAPTWFFVLTILAATFRFVVVFFDFRTARQQGRVDLFFCKCQVEDKVHASSEQVKEENRVDVPCQLQSIDENMIHC